MLSANAGELACMAPPTPLAFGKPEPEPFTQTGWRAVHPEYVRGRRVAGPVSFAPTFFADVWARYWTALKRAVLHLGWASSLHRNAWKFRDPRRLSVSLKNLGAALGLLELLHAHFCIV